MLRLGWERTNMSKSHDFFCWITERLQGLLASIISKKKKGGAFPTKNRGIWNSHNFKILGEMFALWGNCAWAPQIYIISFPVSLFPEHLPLYYPLPWCHLNISPAPKASTQLWWFYVYSSLQEYTIPIHPE